VPRYLPLAVIHPSESDPGTAQTPGSLLLAAITHSKVETASGAAPSSSSPAGAPEFTTTASRRRSSKCSKASQSCAGASMANRKPWSAPETFTPHREINPSQQRPFRWIVVRSTPDPIVVNLPDDYWGQSASRCVGSRQRRSLPVREILRRRLLRGHRHRRRLLPQILLVGDDGVGTRRQPLNHVLPRCV
jgi:hypothetical protein